MPRLTWVCSIAAYIMFPDVQRWLRKEDNKHRAPNLMTRRTINDFSKVMFVIRYLAYFVLRRAN